MKKNDLNYEYSALSEKERQEIENIKRKYEQPKENKGLERLRKLNEKVKFAPAVFAYCFGIISVLIFGLGFTMVLEWELYIWGSVVATLGALACIVAYPLYRILHIKVKTQYSDEIIEISHNLLEENDRQKSEKVD